MAGVVFAASSAYSDLDGSLPDVYTLVVTLGTATPLSLSQPERGAADDGLIFYPAGPSFGGSPPSCAPVRDLHLVLHACAAECRIAQARQRLLRCWHLSMFPCCWVLRLSSLHGFGCTWKAPGLKKQVFLLQGVFNCRACGTDTTVCTVCACGYTLVRMQIMRRQICWI